MVAVGALLTNAGFNPRARTGRDQFDDFNHPDQGFNPRARTGRDTAVAISFQQDEPFQSTRPYRARRCRCRASYPMIGFNPRAREGRDSPMFA